MKNISFSDYNVGSTQPLIRQSDLKEIELTLPPAALLDDFSKMTEIVFSKISENKLQIRTLEKFRNTLLPKLISGEIRVTI